jgi:hypothetical protein
MITSPALNNQDSQSWLIRQKYFLPIPVSKIITQKNKKVSDFD